MLNSVRRLHTYQEMVHLPIRTLMPPTHHTLSFDLSRQPLLHLRGNTQTSLMGQGGM